MRSKAAGILPTLYHLSKLAGMPLILDMTSKLQTRHSHASRMANRPSTLHPTSQLPTKLAPYLSGQPAQPPPPEDKQRTHVGKSIGRRPTLSQQRSCPAPISVASVRRSGRLREAVSSYAEVPFGSYDLNRSVTVDDFIRARANTSDPTCLLRLNDGRNGEETTISKRVLDDFTDLDVGPDSILFFKPMTSSAAWVFANSCYNQCSETKGNCAK
ncbi:hypothetical protein BU23DRAFT_625679 [Bimuria novae-zelandiae CBS 107.79]|uniref:Uncharacterized protein n=1 Tax=Bimuria novae-zelandiae CBS 107.79 TaxID=1447943 RepID=A0A6A5VUW8_9PLEO|nr:hypothetical protein BU23DRAFT_625679 [Bimuria novae-zelandiae CBS 107.79]